VKIWKSISELDTDQVLDVVGEKVPFKKKQVASIFFIDLEPDANWAHKCTYLAIVTKGDGEPEAVSWEWPPQDMWCWKEL